MLLSWRQKKSGQRRRRRRRAFQRRKGKEIRTFLQGDSNWICGKGGGGRRMKATLASDMRGCAGSTPRWRRSSAGAVRGASLAPFAVDPQAEDGRDEDAGPDGDHQQEEAHVGALGAANLRLVLHTFLPLLLLSLSTSSSSLVLMMSCCAHRGPLSWPRLARFLY